ncbi:MULTISPECIES: DsbA family oxidoreductase [Pseudonocardia]|uniref:DSBA-like thioredoxin domain protein n=2 Tax=Pseudonocardia TaxID=1847 RepID=A0A1Y2MZL9_PSEAH|nr:MULTISPECIES: DsbA family oxidoreductase [Pseudonocardia]OSY40098.1 DSBA-like thioredoxin domain protein [Pseudonocardia autotrophica]TDN72956.1 putative DsbA family dithiol-disulfide isomerase [Pseudonocardia autotrophica]BBG03676.1 DSBA oxidoreductase [Pseudonocardia autotrophica]GEC26374.1 DSBA oxidoreductase [Pseudonocardia saturnea]
MEIWSDVVCPWCAIGKRRFEAALAGFAHRDDVEVRWRSFQLDPQASGERESGPGPLAAKLGVSVEQAREMLDGVTATAAEDGLEFRFDIARHGNTLDAHRLLHLAWELGGASLQGALKERLLRASFTEGEPVGDPDTLAQLAASAGVPEADARAVLGSDRYLDAVRGDQELARRYGISGVPFFVIDDRFGVSGAQPAEAFGQALDRAWADAHPLTPVGDDGRTCADGSCTT